MKLRALYEVPAAGVKALTRMVFRRAPSAAWSWARSSFDYLASVGDGTGSSTVMAPLLWVAKTFPEAPPMLWRIDESNGQETPDRSHPLLRLLQRPNEHYTGPILWMATLMDWNVDGNAYWLLLRDPSGVVREIWWMPSWMVSPCGDEDSLVTHYEYRPTNEKLDLRVEDVVHFRYGLDPEDGRRGYSPLKSVLREVFTDDEAARFTSTLLRNMGVPGLMVAPDTTSRGAPSPDDVTATKAFFAQAFSGDKRGEPLVMSSPTTVTQFGFSPEQMLLKELRRIPEERVSAVLGVPAIVAGLGAGLDRATFTNMSEAREMAYESNIIPTQRILAEDIRFQLLNQWEGDDGVFAWRFGFDLSKVRVLQDDQDKLASRMNLGVANGWAKRSDARRALGLEVAPDGSDEVYLIPQNIAEVAANGSGHRTFTPDSQDAMAFAVGEQLLIGAASTNGNGNGGVHVE